MTRFRMFKAFSAALLALALIGPIGASAAVPILTPTWSVIPTTVHDGDYVAFRGAITNDDTSTVSQLYLVELTRDPNLTLVSISTSQGTCDTTTDPNHFKCTLGQLKPHKTAKVTAVYLTALVASPATQYTASGSWEFNTTGLGSGGGDNSHGDSWPSESALTVNVTNDGDFGGRYVLTNNDKIVENSQALNNLNPHSTRAFSPVVGIGVTVEDIDCTQLPIDPICGTLTGGFGQISRVNVNDGLDVGGLPGTNPTLLHFYIQFDSSEILQGVNAGNVIINHTYVPEVAGDSGFESITARCTFAKKATIPIKAPCISPKNLSGGDLGVDIWTFHNGGFKGA